MQKEYAIIVAGGKGSRFGGSLPKQFLELNGKPVLLHTLEAFFGYSENIIVILVLPEEDVPAWKKIANKHGFQKPLILQAGGATRFQSVKKGLQMISGDGIVAIHDGVRPLVTAEIIGSSFKFASTHQSAIATVRLKDSLRALDDAASVSQSKAVDRSLFRKIQTPQTFQISLIQKAYEIAEDPTLTDDASVVERAGYPVYLFEGSYENIKITTPEDLIIAEALLNRRLRQ